ncbi:MAG: riboflavin synthase [Sandaracinus sp.]
MFTGLVQTVGSVVRVERRGVDATVRIACGFTGYEHGESIAVDGCCLSVTASGEGWFEAQASAETLRLTVLGDRAPGDAVHLERALRSDQKLGGHLVTGHVDGVGAVVRHERLGDALEVGFEVPAALAPFLAPKGSICVDGVSLTVNRASGTRFDVVLVPVTQKETRLATRGPGSRVNLEVDVLAKYVARLLGRPGVDGVDPGGSGGVTMDHLKKHGFA